MNHRIKELVEQAGIYQSERFDTIDGSNQLEKFAELIVQECTNIVLHYTDVDEGVVVVKKHFGIDKVNKPGVFYFEFRFEDEETDDEVATNNWAFNLTPDAIAILGENFTESEWMDEAFSFLEARYGVHDWSSGPVDTVVGIGYTTYEVSRKDAPKLVEQWRKKFSDKVGSENVSSKIYDLGTKSVENDLDAYNRVKEQE